MSKKLPLVNSTSIRGNLSSSSIRAQNSYSPRGVRPKMALSLLLQAPSEGRSSPGAHRNRWMFAPDLPTTLRESQLAIVGCVLPSARGGAQQPQCQDHDEAAQAAGQQADDAEVATIEQISSGWQLTRHGACGSRSP